MARFIPRLTLAAALALSLVGGCNSEAPPQTPAVNSGPITVATTYYPTTYFTQRIAGDLVRVTCPVPEGADPIFWQPSAEDIGTFQSADLIVLNGAGFEKWAANVALPPSKLVDTAESFSSTLIMMQGPTHSHGTDGDHTHEGIDGHTWLDPINAIEQSRAIQEALARLLPEHAETLRINLDGLVSDLRGLDSRFTKHAEKNRGTRFVASHPAYNYLARRYQWSLVSLDLDPALPITDEQLEQLRAAGLPTSGRASFVLWESTPIEETVARIGSELGTPMILLSTVETLSQDRIAAGEDYLTIMNANIDRLEGGIVGGDTGDLISP